MNVRYNSYVVRKNLELRLRVGQTGQQFKNDSTKRDTEFGKETIQPKSLKFKKMLLELEW